MRQEGNAAAGQLEEVRARLDQCSVRAPVNGFVIDVVSNPGQFMSLAVPAPLMHLAPDGSLQVRAEVDTRDVQKVCAAQPATVTVDGLTTPPIHAQVEIDQSSHKHANAFCGGEGKAEPGCSPGHSDHRR